MNLCKFCLADMGNKENLYGTICTKCYKYIPPESEPKIVQYNKMKLQKSQEIIREYLKKKITGEKNGN